MSKDFQSFCDATACHHTPGSPQEQYRAGRTPRPNNGPPNMAAANFVVITNGEECAFSGTAVAAVFIDQ